MSSLEATLDKVNWDELKFEPRPMYSKDGDCLIHHFKNILPFADVISNELTLYRDPDNYEVVGYQIVGVSKVMSFV